MEELIRKQDAVELAMEYCPDDDGSVGKDGDLRELLDELENLPPVNGDLIQKIEEGIKATTPTDEYSIGMRNGMKWCKSLLDGKEPKYDIVQPKYKALASFDISTKDEFAIKVERALLKAYKEQLENLPPVQPKRGKWVKISPANIYECSKCGKNVMTNDISEYNFCHGCGADMRGEQE